MKSLVRLALLRAPGHGARELLASLATETEKVAPWRARFSTAKLDVDASVGMPHRARRTRPSSSCCCSARSRRRAHGSATRL